MPITLTRPMEADGTRLFYRTYYDVQRGKVGGHFRGPLYIPPRGKNENEKGLFRLLDTDNVIAQLRLYRWFSKEYQSLKKKEPPLTNFSGLVLKNDFMKWCFADHPTVNKTRVGRLLRLVVQYETNFQQNATKFNNWTVKMNWRWGHPLDIVYGLEHLMLCWLPRAITADGGSCDTTEEFLEELDIIREQSNGEDQELISAILRNRLY